MGNEELEKVLDYVSVKLGYEGNRKRTVCGGGFKMKSEFAHFNMRETGVFVC